VSDADPRTWASRILGGAFSLLLAALLLYVAVAIVQAIWVVLVVVAVMVGIAAGLGIWLRARFRGW
jgi:hypothetical protein